MIDFDSPIISGFSEAHSFNLPKVDIFMVVDFMNNDEIPDASIMKLKQLYRSSEEKYGDDAVGYVCLKEQVSRCTVKAKICTEYQVPIKYYNVTIIVNTDTEVIEDMSCEDCEGSSKICEHSFALLMWLYRKSEPPPSESECYWIKPFLALEIKSMRMADLFKREVVSSDEDDKDEEGEVPQLPDSSEFLKTVLKIAEEKQIDCPLTRHCITLKKYETYKLSIHRLIIEYIKSVDMGVDKFIEYCNSQYTQELCTKIYDETQQESDSSLWEEMRYARITASLIHEAAHCNSSDEDLMEILMAADDKFYITKTSQQKHLKSAVIAEIEKQLQRKLKKCGLMLIPQFPIFCASPDALGEDFVLEVKCPNLVNNVDNYITNGNVCEKYKAQIHLQMFAANVKKGLFCVADTQFDSNKVIHLTWINYDSNYMHSLLNRAMKYWKENIFCKISNSARQ